MRISLALSLGISLLGPSLGGSAWAALAGAGTSAAQGTPSTTPPFVGPTPGMAPHRAEPAPQITADGQPVADGETDELGLTADDYAAAIEYDVSYDDSVAQTYDDGYDPQAYTQFQDTLAPYGSWVDDPAYGQVWVPSPSVVGDNFSPYTTNGDWVDSEYGWTWVSGWSWGWAPFHYGRWTTVANHGWGWVPGTIWGPSWVSWRVGAGCVGWAPLPPRGVRLGSPLGPGSPWRFVGAAGFGHARGGYLPAAAVRHVFGRMSVVSNGRLLRAGGASVRVNVGPARRGQAGLEPAHLASVAPGALPRFAVQPHVGAPLASRPWIHAGVTRQLAFNPRPAGPANQRAPDGGPMSGSLRPSTSGRYGSPVGLGGAHAAAPVVRSFASPGSYGRPSAYGPAPAVRTLAPASGTTYSPPRQWQSAPSFAPPAYARPSAPPTLGGTSRSFGGSAPSFGGGQPSFGGRAPSSGGGHAFSGGHAGGGGGRRH